MPIALMSAASPAMCWLLPGESTPWRRRPDGTRAWSLSEAVVPREKWPLIEYARLGKKTAGRILDGRTHDEYPL